MKELFLKIFTRNRISILLTIVEKDIDTNIKDKGHYIRLSRDLFLALDFNSPEAAADIFLKYPTTKIKVGLLFT